MAQNTHLQETLLRLPQVLSRFPVSRSGWYAGMKSGKYPSPIKTGPRSTRWKVGAIRAYIASLTAESAAAA